MFIENGMRVCYFCIFWKELFPSHSWKYLCVFQLKVSYIPRYKDIPFKKYIDMKYRNEEQNSLGKKNQICIWFILNESFYYLINVCKSQIYKKGLYN